ncbi:MAG: hypothetical protein HY288_08215 [Planctomycetia bacterium]|nr:hypothetical protein [Planctomycetia bacterium]
MIAAIVALAVAAALFSTWYHYRHAHRSREFWGTSMAVLIAQAPAVEALKLDAAEEGPSQDQPDQGESHTVSPIEFGGRSWTVVSGKEALKAPGMSNVRRALVLDTTFDWTSLPSKVQPNWQYALEFTDERQWATVLFDFDSRQIALTGGKKTALLDPAANNDMREFFAEQFTGPK